MTAMIVTGCGPPLRVSGQQQSLEAQRDRHRSEHRDAPERELARRDVVTTGQFFSDGCSADHRQLMVVLFRTAGSATGGVIPVFAGFVG